MSLCLGWACLYLGKAGRPLEKAHAPVMMDRPVVIPRPTFSVGFPCNKLLPRAAVVVPIRMPPRAPVVGPLPLNPLKFNMMSLRTFSAAMDVLPAYARLLTGDSKVFLSRRKLLVEALTLA